MILRFRKMSLLLSQLCIVTLLSILLLAGCASDGGSLGDSSNPVAPPNDLSSFDDIPASRIAELLSPGWNLGNQLEGVSIKTDAATGSSVTVPNETGYSATKISNELLAKVKAAGFKFVRIPISFFSYIDDKNGYTINPVWMARIKEVVDMCLANGLYCMINIHGDAYYTIRNSWLLCAAPDQKPIIAKYSAVWKQLAEQFRDYDESVLFESMNEVFDGNYSGTNPVAYENINAYNEVFVKTVRSTGGNNERRWLLLPGWNTNIDQTVDKLGQKGAFRLPKDKRLMVSVHYYDPWGFCGGENGTATQWGSFAANPEKVNGSEIAMAKQFNKLQETFTSKGIPVVVGEWGSIDKTTDDPASTTYRAYFARKLSENAKRTGSIPVIWDNAWNGPYGFALFNRGTKADDTGTIVKASVSVSQPAIIKAIMDVYTPIASTNMQATVSLDKEKITLEMGSRASLKASLSKAGKNDILSWQSWDETVALVENGVVVPAGPGTTTVAAVLSNGNVAYCDVTVQEIIGVQAKVYLFEGAGWSSVKSDPLFIKAGTEASYDVSFKASELVLKNIAAMYIKDVEVEENHAPTSKITSCSISVESITINGVPLPLVRNKDQEAVNGKGQFDLPFLNEWAVDKEMVDGLPASGHRDMTKVLPTAKIQKEGNVVRVVFKTVASAPKPASTLKVVAKPVMNPDTVYHAYLGIQAADSWVFRNSYGNGSYGGETEQFARGLFDTENALGEKGHVPGKITDTEITKKDVEARKTFKVTMVDFSLDDAAVKSSALNVAMISTDIPYGSVEVVSAKLFFDGKQVNLTSDGTEIFSTELDKSYLLVNFINIWQTSLKTFGYKMPTKNVSMELTLTLK